MKKVISLIILLLLTIISLSGCAKVEYTTTINKDGSGKISYLCAVNKTVMKNIDNDSTNETLREKARNAGYDIQDYEDEETAGFMAIKEVNDITDKSYIGEIFDEYVKNIEESKIKIKTSFLGKTYSQNVVIGTKSLKSLGELGAKIQYTVNLPTKVSKTNADTVSKDKTTLTWNIKLGEEQEQTIYFKATSGAIYFWIGIIVIVIIATTVIYIFVFKKQKNIGKEKNNKEKQSKSK